MDNINLILCGLGGQGILFMTRVLAESAVKKGFHMMSAETHGMAQRGGSVISHLRLGDVESSLVRIGTSHFLLALDENEGYRNLPFLSEGGSFFANSDNALFPREEVKEYLEKKEMNYFAVPATKLACYYNAPRSSNLALLGYVSVYITDLITHKEMKATIEDITPKRFKKINLEIFNAGYQKGLSEKGVR